MQWKNGPERPFESDIYFKCYALWSLVDGEYLQIEPESSHAIVVAKGKARKSKGSMAKRGGSHYAKNIQNSMSDES